MYREEDVKAIVLMLMAAAAVLGIPVAAVFGAYCSYQSSKEFCNKQGNEYNFELFGSSICEADDAGKKEVLESKLAEHLPVKQYKLKDYRIVNRVKNPDGSYTMEVVGQYEGKDMEYHGVFRNVVSLEQEEQRKKERAERVAKENKVVQEALDKKKAYMCNDLSGNKYVKSVKYDAETNTCIVVSEEPVVSVKEVCPTHDDPYVNPLIKVPESVPYYGLFIDEESKVATGTMGKYVKLKEEDSQFKDFIVETRHSVEVDLEVSFPNAKNFAEDFAEKCAKDENCNCEEDEDGDTICEKHITKPVVIAKGDLFPIDDLSREEIGYPRQEDVGFDDDCNPQGEDSDAVATPNAIFVKEARSAFVSTDGVVLTFDDVRVVTDKTYRKYNDCLYSNGCYGSDSAECVYKCAESVTTGNPQSFCIDTYKKAKYKNGICEVPFDGKVSKAGDLKKDFESCKINKIIAGKGNTATVDAVCNGLRVNINLINYQVQNRASKGR